MLVLDNKLNNLAVASVQASRAIGQISGYIIDPRKLAVVALYVDTRANQAPLILHTSDIREFTARGVVIDHDDQLMNTDGLVRLQEVINFKFQLIGKPVETDVGRGLGKVSAFAFDSLSWRIMRLHVGQSVVKSVNTSELIIHRQQILKVSNQKVVVNSATVKTKQKFSLKRLFLGGKPALNPESITTSEE